jgi:hypothetical protein
LPLSELSDLKQFIAEADKGFDTALAEPIQNAFTALAEEITA